MGSAHLACILEVVCDCGGNLIIASSLVWSVSEGASAAASDLHSVAVSESEARSREAASAWWHSKVSVRCDSISFRVLSKLDVTQFLSPLQPF